MSRRDSQMVGGEEPLGSFLFFPASMRSPIDNLVSRLTGRAWPRLPFAARNIGPSGAIAAARRTIRFVGASVPGCWFLGTTFFGSPVVQLFGGPKSKPMNRRTRKPKNQHPST